MKKSDIAFLADKFWQKAGFIERFPRSLEQAVAWALPIAIVKLPRLQLSDVGEWLKQRGITFEHGAHERRLRACLVAKRGTGLIFIDGSDTDDERRFSLAHEVAHYICDYLEPRLAVLTLLGDAGAEILDGIKKPTIEERVSGLLSGVHIGTFTQLMERLPTGDIGHGNILEAEDRADLLALELLAPKQIVLKRLSTRVAQWADPSALVTTQTTLKTEFGLPTSVALSYARMLVSSRRRSRTFSDWLGY